MPALRLWLRSYEVSPRRWEMLPQFVGAARLRSWISDPDDFARIHDVVGVQRALQRAHDVELDLAAVVRKLIDLDAADAVLGRDRAAIGCHQIVDRAADLVAIGHELRLAPAGRRLAVEVKVAVANMAEWHRPALGQRLLHRRQPFRHEGGELAHRYRDVVLDRGAFLLLAFGVTLAHRPEGTGQIGR